MKRAEIIEALEQTKQELYDRGLLTVDYTESKVEEGILEFIDIFARNLTKESDE